MTIKEQVLETIEHFNDAALSQLLEKAQEIKEIQRQARIERQLKLLEQFAEPMEDPETEKQLLEVMERRPWFGGRIHCIPNLQLENWEV